MYIYPYQNGQGWKWPCCAWRLNTLKCLKLRKNQKKNLFLLLDALILKNHIFLQKLSFYQWFQCFSKFSKKARTSLPLASLIGVYILDTIAYNFLWISSKKSIASRHRDFSKVEVNEYDWQRISKKEIMLCYCRWHWLQLANIGKASSCHREKKT